MSTADVAEQRLEVIVSEDRLLAHLRLNASDGERPSLEQALEQLAGAHVAFGIDPPSVQEALDSAGTTVLVARGVPPVDGVDGTIAFAPDLLSVGGHPRVTEHGEVDLFDLGLVHNVATGTVLVTLTPPTAGEAGTDVAGRVLPARVGRAARIVPGPGCQWSTDRRQVLAAIAGHPTLVGETVTVSAIYRVHGNVGPATGNIDFVGSVCVAGDVMQGYRVQAGGDVEIQGSVESADVEAGGNVSVRYGIRGHLGHGRVCAAGTVRAKFIEFAEVHAERSVFASDGIVCSVVEAGEAVDVLGRHGSIVGGRVVAGHSIRVGELGSARGVTTEVHVGSAPKLLTEAQTVKNRLAEVAVGLQVVQERLGALQSYEREGRLNDSGKLSLDDQHRTYRNFLHERVELLSRQRDLLQRLRAVNKARVSVRSVCHAGVRVAIGGMSHVVDEEFKGVQFQRDERGCTVQLVST